MRGRVSPDGREPIIQLTVFGDESSDEGVEVHAVVDTGFTGDLTLPAESVSSLALTERGFVEAQLADGTITALRTYEARVLWHGRVRRVLVCQTAGAALAGMSLMRDSTLTIEVLPNGPVTISGPTLMSARCRCRWATTGDWWDKPPHATPMPATVASTGKTDE